MICKVKIDFNNFDIIEFYKYNEIFDENIKNILLNVGFYLFNDYYLIDLNYYTDNEALIKVIKRCKTFLREIKLNKIIYDL